MTNGEAEPVLGVDDDALTPGLLALVLGGDDACDRGVDRRAHRDGVVLAVLADRHVEGLRDRGRHQRITGPPRLSGLVGVGRTWIGWVIVEAVGRIAR